MAAMDTSLLSLAADDKAGDAEILPPLNHECQPRNFHRVNINAHSHWVSRSAPNPSSEGTSRLVD